VLIVKAREKPSFTFGIEEEYFLVDPRTRALVSEPPKSVLDECKAELGQHVSAEYQRSQIEVATRICTHASQAREHLGHLDRSDCVRTLGGQPMPHQQRLLVHEHEEEEEESGKI
jgi:gamma-glutamyl:cysteine ligase YbdK (ATP-grasp superfamily)